jgi:hypothetical protein
VIHIILKLNLKVFSNIIISRQQKKYRFTNYSLFNHKAKIGNYPNIQMKTCGLTSVPSSGASDRKAIKSRVFNGDIARLGDFPWMTSIKVQDMSHKFKCVGALISDHWILTSAHCLTQLALSAFRIFL